MLYSIYVQREHSATMRHCISYLPLYLKSFLIQGGVLKHSDVSDSCWHCWMDDRK